MSANLKQLEEIISQLSPESQAEVVDFASFLLEKRKKKSGGKLSQKWAGGLSDLREKYTSLELQKKGVDWMIEDALKGTSISLDEDVSA